MFNDGSLYLTKVQLIHAGNYTCHAVRNQDVVQTHVLTIHSKFLGNASRDFYLDIFSPLQGTIIFKKFSTLSYSRGESDTAISSETFERGGEYKVSRGR